MSRAMELDSFHQLLERARAHSFPLSKRARLFPSAAYRRSAPPQLALGRLQWRCLGCFGTAGMVSQRGKTSLIFSSAVGAILTQPAAVWDNSVQLGYFCNAKGQRDFISTLAFSIQLTRSHNRPASRGTCRATAVKPRPTCFPSSTPAPYGRGVGCRGSPPAQVGGKDGELAVTGFGGKTG